MSSAPEIYTYLDIPYTHGGRSRESGVDCYGLLYVYYLEQFGVELPEYSTVLTEEEQRTLLASSKALLSGVQLDHPEDHCVVVLDDDGLNGVPHVGIYVGGGVLHATIQRGVLYEKITSRAFKARFDKRYRIEFWRILNDGQR